MGHMKAPVHRARRPRAHDFAALAATVKTWGRELGFQAVGIADTDLAAVEPGLAAWLERGFAGELDYMRKHGAKRTRPASLVPGTLRVISARIDYRPDAADSWSVLADGSKAFVARYALGRDYHKVLRGRLRRLAGRIEREIGEFGYRVFTDSAPVMEVELARKAGLGWRGKHTLLLSREAGSFFFLGEIYTDLPLPVDAPVGEHCGTCAKCIDVCPTRAIVAPYTLGAQRPGQRRARRAFRLAREPVPRVHGRQRDPENRLRALVAQSRRGTRQCTQGGARGRRAAFAREGPFSAGARARRLGARASCSELTGALRVSRSEEPCGARRTEAGPGRKKSSGVRDVFAIMFSIVIHPVRRFPAID